jgi:hypothetical protein
VELMRALEAMPEVEKTSIFGTAVHAVLRTRGTTLEALAARLRQSGIEVAECVMVEPSLEDVFLDLALAAAPQRRRTGAGALQ